MRPLPLHWVPRWVLYRDVNQSEHCCRVPRQRTRHHSLNELPSSRVCRFPACCVCLTARTCLQHIPCGSHFDMCMTSDLGRVIFGSRKRSQSLSCSVTEHCEDSRFSEHCEDSCGSEHCEGSRGSEHCEGSRVPEVHVYAQDRDRFRPLKRRVEVSMRNLSREDRDAFNRAKQKEWTKSHPPCPLGADMEERSNRESSES